MTTLLKFTEWHWIGYNFNPDPVDMWIDKQENSNLLGLYCDLIDYLKTF